MIFGLPVQSKNDVEYVRNIAFWVRRLFELTQYRVEKLSTDSEVRITRTLYVVDTSSGALTITLPPAKDAKNEWLEVKNLDGSHKITVAAQSGETIDGSAIEDINTAKSVHRFISDGVEWYCGSTH